MILEPSKIARPGDPLRKHLTAKNINDWLALVPMLRMYGVGGITVNNTSAGVSISLDPSALKGGAGAPIECFNGFFESDDQYTLMPYATQAFKIVNAIFVCDPGVTTNFTVSINGTPVSWLSALAAPTGLLASVGDGTDQVPQGGALTIACSGTAGSGKATFSLIVG